MPEFVIEKRNIPVLTIASNSRNGRTGGGADGNGTGENPLGFRITGGADFEMPITIFQVKENSPAAKAGLALGDQIITINGADASAMRLKTAESVIQQAGEQLQLVVAKDDEEAAKNPNKPKETRAVKFAGTDDASKADVTNNPSAPKHKPDAGRADWIQPPERKVWHPIVWQQPPPPIPPDVYGKDAPHQRLIANIRRLLTETVGKPEERKKHIENMMLSLPTGSKKNEDDEDEPPKPPPKPKRKGKKGKKKTVVRKRTESTTTDDDSVSQDLSASLPA
ncbi:PDZ and LIM domain protein 7-like isoform X2 [Topomyia yanbarensis]|uniref:PDZ and LIM domain protein 7-like isoform X2 n=1 Tax=Topomyia yanbarensis TaxID=2498891 RepID=UPI00273C4878|nr:PDZ and LIM domain protein 7-like isoform X2 [Topomyia yanbarensis]